MILKETRYCYIIIIDKHVSKYLTTQKQAIFSISFDIIQPSHFYSFLNDCLLPFYFVLLLVTGCQLICHLICHFFTLLTDFFHNKRVGGENSKLLVQHDLDSVSVIIQCMNVLCRTQDSYKLNQSTPEMHCPATRIISKGCP